MADTTTLAQIFDNSDVKRIDGYIIGDFSGGFDGWTQAGDESVVVTLADPAVVPLAFKPPTGATADATDQIEVYDDAGTLRFFVDATGSCEVRATADGDFAVTVDDQQCLTVSTAGAQIAQACNLAFFGASPVAQQSITGALSTVTDAVAKAVLTSIIAALVALGLATDGTT